MRVAHAAAMAQCEAQTKEMCIRDRYINLRPIKLYPGVETPLAGKGPEDIDFVVVRENTEDMYAGVGGFLRKGTPHEVAVQEAVYTLSLIHIFQLRPGSSHHDGR